jgi:hypothetical protein
VSERREPNRASGEVYRDPVYDGATDPTVVRTADGWWMFYTQRRATHPHPGPGVAWVHGSRVGIARSADGERWTYVGTLEPDAGGLYLREGAPPAFTEQTHWAPEIISDGDRWRMYLTEIDGVPDRWDGHSRHIVEYESHDLTRWRRCGALSLSSERVIDAAVARCPDGMWRLWYKDEAADSTTWVASSADLRSWLVEGMVIGGRPHEGPYVFLLDGWWWMLTDEWRGMAVYRSNDAISWERQGGADAVILGGYAAAGDGVQVGRHGSVRVEGDGARLYYFTHPWWDGSEIADAADIEHRRSAVHSAFLHVVDGILAVAA